MSITIEDGPERESPPLDAYADEDEGPKANGAHAPRAYPIIAYEEFLAPGIAPEFIVDGLFESKAVIGVVAPPEAGKSLLMQEIAVCVAMGRSFHGRATARGLVVYLAGEGQNGLNARFQALATRYPVDGDIVPLGVGKIATSLIDPIEELRVATAIESYSQRYQLPLHMLVIDTLARFISPGDESKAQDMGAYLAAVDRLRRGAAAVTLHHPGHGDATRGRGSSSWKAALDVEYSLAKADDVITVTCQKMKDGMKPEPFSFKLESVATRMTRKDGTAIHAPLLVSTETHVSKPKVTGKNQKTLLAKLLTLPVGSIWTDTELREVALSAGLNRNRAWEAILGLRQLHFLVPTIGGSRLSE